MIGAAMERCWTKMLLQQQQQLLLLLLMMMSLILPTVSTSFNATSGWTDGDESTKWNSTHEMHTESNYTTSDDDDNATTAVSTTTEPGIKQFRSIFLKIMIRPFNFSSFTELGLIALL